MEESFFDATAFNLKCYIHTFVGRTTFSNRQKKNCYCDLIRTNIGKRGKGKKKKRRALMKLLLIGAVLKAKIELLLKIIATHLQIKFFVVAVIGLIVNIARFWVDLKRSQQPQKVWIRLIHWPSTQPPQPQPKPQPKPTTTTLTFTSTPNF